MSSAKPSLTATAGEPSPLAETATAPADAQPGASSGVEVRGSVGRYVVLEELGRGGMGVVYVAFDPELDRKVALKVLKPRGAIGLDTAAHARLQREARAMARLAHPNVIAVHDVGQWEGRVFVAMELVPGQTLTQWAETPRPWTEVVPVMTQAARGLLAAHEAGLVHRDFKPDNCIVGDDGRVRVLDFGLARGDDATEAEDSAGPSPGSLSDSLTATGAIMGTPAYMAPEQHVGDPSTAQTDQFAFCVSLYSILYRHKPFAGNTLSSLMVSVLEDEPRVPEDRRGVPGWLHRAIVRGLSKMPGDRWPSMADLLRELERLETARARRRWLAVLLFAAAAVVAALAGVDAWRARQARLAAEAREQAAVDRLNTLRPKLAAWVEAGATDDAHEAVDAFTRLPEVVGTRAQSAGWLTYSRLLGQPDHLPLRLQAAANAYAAALDEEAKREVLLHLVTTFRESGRWDELRAALTLLDDDDPDVVSDRVVSAMASREFAAAADYARRSGGGEGITPLADAWRYAARVELPDGNMRLGDFDGDGALDLVTSDEEGLVQIRRLDESLTLEASYHVEPFRRVLILEGERSILTSIGIPTSQTNTVVRLVEDGTAEVLGQFEDHLRAVASGDVDGDGIREHYGAVAHYGRRLRRLDIRGDKLELSRPVAPAERAKSDLLGTVAGDFDGDGDLELAVAAATWQAYDVRIFDGEAAGLRLRDRLPLGVVMSLALLPGKPDRLVAHLMEEDPNAETPHPTGIYVLAWRDGELQIESYLEVPRQLERGGRLRTGDVDGDGRVDIVMGAGRGTWVAQATADGFATVFVQDMVMREVVQLDDDPALEVIVNPAWRRRDETWVLGLGDSQLPPRPAAVESATEPPPEIASTDLARTWMNAEALVAMGLQREAIEVFERTATLASSSEHRDLALVRAGALAEARNELERAAAIYAQGLDDEPSEGLVVAAARLAERRHEFTVAGQLWRRLSTEEATEASRRLEELDVPRVQVWGDGQALPEATMVVQPLALSWEGPHGLRVTADAGSGELLRIPIEVHGARLGLEVEHEILRSEWSSGLEVVIVDDAGESVLVSKVMARGSSADLQRVASVEGLMAKSWAVAGLEAHDRVAIRAERTAATRYAAVTGATTATELAEGEPFTTGRHWLVIRAGPLDVALQTFRIQTRIRSLALRGASVVDEPLAPRDSAALRSVRGQLQVREVPGFELDRDDRVWWAAELERADAHDAAVAMLAQAGPFARDASTVNLLRALVRGDAGRLLPLALEGAGPLAGFAWHLGWRFHATTRIVEPEVAAAMGRDLPVLEALEAAPVGLVAAYSWRGDLHYRRAQWARARSDYQSAVELGAAALTDGPVLSIQPLASAYAGLVDLAVRAGDDEAADHWVERALASGLPAHEVARGLGERTHLAPALAEARWDLDP